jgi:hypothetical protein
MRLFGENLGQGALLVASGIAQFWNLMQEPSHGALTFDAAFGILLVWRCATVEKNCCCDLFFCYFVVRDAFWVEWAVRVLHC